MCILHFARFFVVVVSENLPTRILRAGTTHSDGECTPGCHIWHTYCEALANPNPSLPATWWNMLSFALRHIGTTHVITTCPPNPGSVVTIYQFSQLLSIAWSQAMTQWTIMSGFKATGIFPLNWYAITVPGECPRLSNTPTAILAKKDISFMPFYSPTHATRQLFTSEEQEIEYKGWFEGESEGGIVCSWRRESGRWVSKELYLKTFWVIGLSPQVVPFIISQVIAFFITKLKALLFLTCA